MSNYGKEEINRFALMLKALSNPSRLSIFLRLVNCCAGKAACNIGDGAGECVGELGRDLGIAPSTVSHHIKELNRAGLLKMERHGRNITCSIEAETLDSLRRFFTHPRV